MKRYASGLAAFLVLALPAAGYCTAASTGAPAMEVKNGVTGTVVETKTAGGYTYISLEKEKERAWVACPVMTVKVGQPLTFRDCTPMMNFESKALKRTFDIIMFCGAPLPPATAALLSKQSTGSNVAVPELKEKVAFGSAKGKNAHTVADCYAKRAALDKKTVTVKGKVMKVSTGIMGRTWIHLQDGSGSVFQKNNDLVITTHDLPRVGDVVTFTGTLLKDKDFGSGYSYKVIIEQATIQK
jgi:hypothetical protein